MLSAASASAAPALAAAASAPSARRLAASACAARARADCSLSTAGAGHTNVTASTDSPPAIPQPASRSGICDAGPGNDTGRMKLSSSDVVAPASTELTTDENTIATATTVIAATARTSEREHSVPTDTSPPPTSTSAIWSRARSGNGPRKSTSSSVEIAPNAANVAVIGLPIT